MEDFEFLGCSFFELYESKKTEVRWQIKKAQKNKIRVEISPSLLIKTEEMQDKNKIKNIIVNFDKNLFYYKYIQVFNWGCGMLILDGHHRAIAAVEIGLKTITVEMSIYKC